jgi:hypothetical protein
MTPGVYNLALYRGDTFKVTFKLWSKVDGVKVPVDLTGAFVAAEIRDKPSGSQIVAMAATVVLPNSVDMEITADQWADTFPAGVWDLEVTFPDGVVQTPVGGSVTVTPDVTNSGTALREATRWSA